MNVDLHCHTNLSDGSLAPSALIDLAVERNIDMLSITDHDTLAAYRAIDEAPANLRIIPGIELSSQWRKSGVHIVGLNLDMSSDSILEAVAQQSKAAEREDFELADKLAGMIGKHAADEKEHERILHNINLAVKELDTQREDVMKGLTQCFIDVQMNLRQFKNEREELEKNNGKKVRSYATIICVYNCMCAFIDVCILCPIAFSSIMYNASPHSVPHSRSLHHLGQRQVPDDIQASFCRGGKTCYGSEAS